MFQRSMLPPSSWTSETYTSPTLPSLIWSPNKFGEELQTIKLLIMKLSPVSCYFLSLRNPTVFSTNQPSQYGMNFQYVINSASIINNIKFSLKYWKFIPYWLGSLPKKISIKSLFTVSQLKIFHCLRFILNDPKSVILILNFLGLMSLRT